MITYNNDAAAIQKLSDIITAAKTIENTRNGFQVRRDSDTVIFSPMYDNKLDKWVTRIVQESISTVNNMLAPSRPSYTYVQNLNLLEQCRNQYAHMLHSNKTR